jgi:hypothetical protein
LPIHTLPTQITRVLRKVDNYDGITLPYSGPNLTTMLSGVTDPTFVLQRIDANGNPYPFTLQARSQTEFQQDFETTWRWYRTTIIILYSLAGTTISI